VREGGGENLMDLFVFRLVESTNLNLKEGGIIKNIKYFFKIIFYISYQNLLKTKKNIILIEKVT
jgi:hypothetical protein